MITTHIKINQLDTKTLKLSSNNDLVLVETTIYIHYKTIEYQISCVPIQVDLLIYGLIYSIDGNTKALTINTDGAHYYVESTDDSLNPLQSHSVLPTSIQYAQLPSWIKSFRSGQKMYSQTGATVSIGALSTENHVIVFEDLSFTNSVYKLLGHLLKESRPFYETFFISHSISMADLQQLALLPLQILISQSAITSTVVDYCTNHNVSLFGFCRKNKYNCYLNYHFK